MIATFETGKIGIGTSTNKEIGISTNLRSLDDISSLIFVDADAEIVGIYDMRELRTVILRNNGNINNFSVMGNASYISGTGMIRIACVSFKMVKQSSTNLFIYFIKGPTLPITICELYMGMSDYDISTYENLKYIYATHF